MRKSIFIGVLILLIAGIVVGAVLLFGKNIEVEDKVTSTILLNQQNKSSANKIEDIKHITSIEELQTFFKSAVNQNKMFRQDVPVVEESATAEAESSSDSSTGGDFSGTNNQVEGIEEGDVIVTDGKHIYSTNENAILITDASDPKDMKQVGKISFDQNKYPLQLMVQDNKLIVILDHYIEQHPTNEAGYMLGMSLTNVAVYDVANPAKPTLIREVGQEGYMNGVRMYNDVLYLITNKSPNYWIFYDTATDVEVEDVELRPYTYDSEEKEKIAPMEVNQLTILPGTMEANYTIISAIDINNFKEQEITTEGYLGGSSTLYMSQNAIYVTAYNYEWPQSIVEGVTSLIATDMMIAPVSTSTNVYKFAIDGTTIEYSASTSFEGSVLNQFSMDEYNGHFRVAVTEGSTWGNEATSKNHLYIYNNKLEKVGEVTDLAKGERIYSARFIGDKAYIVTFKEVDPLFVLDLANPSQPKVLGELKIPGFSNYLHPLDETHLIGIGYDTKTVLDSYTKQPFTVTGGMKISLFDISDFSNPKEQDMAVVGGSGTYSEVQYNHKALFTNSDYSYYGFPISIYEENGEYGISYKGHGAVVYEITDENGIELKGDLITYAKEGELYEEWEKIILRLVYIDDTLYTVARNEIKSYDLETFEYLGSVRIQ